MSQTILHNPSVPVRRAILDHVRRYRLTVFEALAKETSLRGISRQMLRHQLHRLCREGPLASARLYHNRRCFYLPIRDAPSRPLSEAAKIRAYALLAFCRLGTERRQRLTPEEIEAHLPELSRPGLPGGYYVAAGAPPRFGLAVLDAGGRGRWDRVLARLRQQLHEHQRHPALAPFIEEDRFELTLVTALPPKAQRLATAIAQWPEPFARHLRIAVIPELLHLIVAATGRAT